jgi:apolipoprotein N-acyltransferase
MFPRFQYSFAKGLFGGRYPFAILAGLIMAAAFPKIGVAGFAWIGPGLLVGSTLGTRGLESFSLGYVGGLAYYLAGLYWLLAIPYRWHGIPLGPAAGWLALSSYLALYPAAWVWLVGSVHRSISTRPNAETSISVAPSLSGALPDAWIHRSLWTLYGATAWVALEMIVARLFSGFPWDLFGVSQYQMLPLIQIVSFTGIYGISFLLVWVSLSLLSAVVLLLRRPGQRSVWITEIFLPVLVVAFLFNFGLRQLRHSEKPARTIKVTFVQPSIPQTLIWDPTQDDQRFRRLIQLSEQALTNKTDLLLWPEAGIPRLLRYDKDIFEAVTGLARKHHVWLMVGSDDAEPLRNSTNPNDAQYFNSSFLIDPNGRLANGYKKRNLVIFGEYVPLARWLPFMKFLTPISGGFTPGDRPVPFELTDLKVKTSPLICFEDVFPQLVRECAQPDTDFLVNMTNDGWFGETAAPWQHATTAFFRAVENHLPLLRCTNTGLTCWVDAQGRLRQLCRDQAGTVYGPAIMTAEIPLLPDGQRRPRTFYNLHGDWFGWTCVAVTSFMLLLKFAKRLSSSQSSPES